LVSARGEHQDLGRTDPGSVKGVITSEDTVTVLERKLAFFRRVVG